MIRRLALALLVCLWIAAVCVGMGWLWSYGHAAGAAASAPEHWPETSVLTRDLNHFTLVMTAHPKCPCTRASVEELSKLITSSKGKLRAYILFVTPKNSSPDWYQTDLWNSAASIPGVTVLTDKDGSETARFGSITSGQAVLYDGLGRLRFSGGLTKSRGHSGDNLGRSTIETLVLKGVADVDRSPVFGCPLFDSNSECRKPDHDSN